MNISRLALLGTLRRATRNRVRPVLAPAMAMEVLLLVLPITIIEALGITLLVRVRVVTNSVKLLKLAQTKRRANPKTPPTIRSADRLCCRLLGARGEWRK